MSCWLDLSKAWSRWTQSSWLCPELHGKLQHRTAGVVGRRIAAGFRVKVVARVGIKCDDAVAA